MHGPTRDESFGPDAVGRVCSALDAGDRCARAPCRASRRGSRPRPAVSSASRIGTQSARTGDRRSGSLLTMASASGAARARDRARRDDDRRLVHLAHEQQSRRGTPMSPATPTHSRGSSRSVRPVRGEEVIGGGVERDAAQRRRPQGACVHSNARLGCGWVMNILVHRTRRHRHPPILATARTLRRSLPAPRVHRGEIAYLPAPAANPVPHLAGRFAAKEAAMKALGTGHSRGVLWKDIEVVRGGRTAAAAVARRRGAPRRGHGCGRSL